MKLTITKREHKGKASVKQARRDGDVPAVMYSSGKSCEMILVNGTELGTILREMKSGLLPTTVFELEMDGKVRRAIIKDIQYDVTSYRVTHIDFEELFDGTPVHVKVPIQCAGTGDCVGVKLGGFLRQVIRFVKVECLPQSIPQSFSVDVRNLGIRQSKRLSDIAFPQGVRPLAPLQEVVVVVAKR